MVFIPFNADAAAIEAEGGDGGGAAAEKRVEDEVAGIGGGEQAAFNQSDGFLGGVLAEGLFVGTRGGDGPNAFNHGWARMDTDFFFRVRKVGF